MASSQQSGRMEILRGKGSKGEPIVLDLASVQIMNDDRMLKSRRFFRINRNTLSYELTMSTTAHPEMSIHVTAQLKKKITQSDR